MKKKNDNLERYVVSVYKNTMNLPKILKYIGKRITNDFCIPDYTVLFTQMELVPTPRKPVSCLYFVYESYVFCHPIRLEV